MSATVQDRPHKDMDSTRELVRRTCLDLFSRLGFNATGMRLIAQEAGVSIATVYHYVTSKDELLLDLLKENILVLLSESAKALQGRRSGKDRIRALVDVHVSIHANHLELCKVSDRELRSLPVDSQATVIDLRDQYETMWRDAILLGKKDSSFVFEDLTITSHALLQMCTGIVHWFQPDGRLSVEELVKLHQELALRMLGVSTGNRS